MITYCDLKNCYAIMREARDRQERMERLRSMAEKCTAIPQDTPSATSKESPDAIGNYACRLVEMQEAADEFYIGAVMQANVISQIIDDIEGDDNADVRTVLRCRYLDGMTYPEISEKTHMSESWLYKQHKKGLEILGVKEGGD